MNKFSLFIWIFIISLSFASHGICQDIKFSAGLGYGAYAMNGLEDFQYSLSYRSAVPYRVVEDFPPYYNWFFGLDFLFNPHEFGFKVNSQSTGSKSTYMDYSGRADLDMVVSEISIGPTYKYQILKKDNHHNFSVGSEAFLGFTELNINESINIYEQTNDEEYIATSFGISLLPNVHYRFKYKFMHVGMQFGYWLGFFNSPLKYKGNVIMDGQDKLKANWSGYRIRLELGFGGTIKE